MADIQVGLAIRLTRCKMNLSQNDVSAEMGAPRSYISRVENNRVRPGIEQFVRFADAMGIEPAELLTYARVLQREAEE